jgi:capsular polysaccharide transport system permease protein
MAMSGRQITDQRSGLVADMFQPLAAQWRVIGALILRETRTRFGKSRLGYAWALLSPLLQISIIAMVFTAAGRHAPPVGDNLMLFFASGVLPYRLCMNTNSMLMSAFQANDALMYYPVVEQLDAIFARLLLELATYLMIMLILFSGIMLYTGHPFPDLLKLFGAVSGLALLALGLGIINAVLMGFIKSWNRIFAALATPLYLMSGVFFIVDTWPPQAREVLAWNPILHGIEMFREGVYPELHSFTLDEMYLFKFGLVLTVVGLAMERVLRRYLRKSN